MLHIEGSLPPEAGAVLLKALEAAGKVLYQNARRNPAPSPEPIATPTLPPVPRPIPESVPDTAPLSEQMLSAEITPISTPQDILPGPVSARALAHTSASTPSPASFWYSSPPGIGGPREGRYQKQADAIVFLAESALESGIQGTATAADRYQVVLHVDADALREEAASGRSHLEAGPALSAETFRRSASRPRHASRRSRLRPLPREPLSHLARRVHELLGHRRAPPRQEGGAEKKAVRDQGAIVQV